MPIQKSKALQPLCFHSQTTRYWHLLFLPAVPGLSQVATAKLNHQLTKPEEYILSLSTSRFWSVKMDFNKLRSSLSRMGPQRPSGPLEQVNAWIAAQSAPRQLILLTSASLLPLTNVLARQHPTLKHEHTAAHRPAATLGCFQPWSPAWSCWDTAAWASKGAAERSTGQHYQVCFKHFQTQPAFMQEWGTAQILCICRAPPFSHWHPAERLIIIRRQENSVGWYEWGMQLIHYDSIRKWTDVQPTNYPFIKTEP